MDSSSVQIEAAGVYLPMDQRQALAHDRPLPEHTEGAALFADISGFTPLTEALAEELGRRRGAEELTIHLNRVYNALVAELHRYGGSVIGFSGDAVTCWLDGDDGARATACALAMQEAMGQFATIETASGSTVSMAMKAAVTTGPVRRFLVGDPECCIADALVGRTLERLVAAEHVARRGDVILAPEAVAALGSRVVVVDWRIEEETGDRFAVVASMTVAIPESPWPALPLGFPTNEQAKPWLLPPVYQHLEGGQGEFLAELRPVVALFLRFGGMDYDSDPAAGDRLDTFVRQVQHVVQRYEGSLLSLTIGDKGSYLYVAFGAPVAHEDDATRAASAALELQALAAGLDYLSGIQIGITQGRMRTGAYGSQTRRTYSALGDAVNLSARLMSAAEAGQILASERVRQAAGTEFSWQDLASIRVKGKREPVPVGSLVGRRQQRAIHFFEPRYALPMVGRQAELDLIAQKVELVRQGKGQIVGITAEAGMGKSRLAAEVIHMARKRGLEGHGGECQSYGTGTSYLVWHRIWQGLFELDPSASLDSQVRTLEAQLTQVDPGLLPRLPLLGSVLNLSIPDSDLTQGLDAKVRKSSLEALLVDCLRARTSGGPLLLVLEDCHWLDPLSHDLIEEIGRAIADYSVLLLMVYRPPDSRHLQAPKISQLPHFTEVVLGEFAPQEAERLICLKLARYLGPEAEISPGFVGRITDRAEGNPFYIEELLNYLQDRGIQPQDSQALEAVDLPSSLYSLILTRMDQLSESQQTTVKVASVIGRLFKAAMVWGVQPQLGSLERIKADLQVLSAVDITPLESPEPELSYLFKHIITQEVAYESLLYATRARLHEEIGTYIERTRPEAAEQYVNLLAFHFERSENEAKKQEYLLKAGEAAQVAYSNAAAIEYYEKVLSLLPVADQVEVLLKQGAVLELIGEWQPARERYSGALTIAKEEGKKQARAQCEMAIAELLRKQGQYSEAWAWLERARTGFSELSDLEGRGWVLHYGGTLKAQQGDYDDSRTLYEESLAIRRRLGDQPQVASLLSNLGIVARFQGQYTRARSLHEEALAIRRELADQWAIGVSLNNLGNVALDQGNFSEARALHEEGLAIRRQVGDRWAIANALNNLGNLARAQGDLVAAGQLYRESLVINQELGDGWALAYLLEDIGCLAALEDEPDRALILAGAASVLREEIGAPLSPTEESKLETALQPAREALTGGAQAEAWAHGRTLLLEEAIAKALSA